MQTLTAIIIALMVIALAVFVGLVWAAKKGLLKGTGHKYTKVRPGLWLLGLSVQSRAGSSQSPKPFSRCVVLTQRCEMPILFRVR